MRTLVHPSMAVAHGVCPVVASPACRVCYAVIMGCVIRDVTTNKQGACDCQNCMSLDAMRHNKTHTCAGPTHTSEHSLMYTTPREGGREAGIARLAPCAVRAARQAQDGRKCLRILYYLLARIPKYTNKVPHDCIIACMHRPSMGCCPFRHFT